MKAYLVVAHDRLPLANLHVHVVPCLPQWRGWGALGLGAPVAGLGCLGLEYLGASEHQTTNGDRLHQTQPATHRHRMTHSIAAAGAESNGARAVARAVARACARARLGPGLGIELRPWRELRPGARAGGRSQC